MSDLLGQIRADAELQKHRRRKRTRCAVGDLIAELDAEDAQAITEALSDYDKYSGASIARVLRMSGHFASETTLKRHRRRDCSCYALARKATDV